MNTPRWAKGSNQYVKRPRLAPPSTPGEDRVLDDLRPDRARALWRFRANWDSMVWSAAMLEGNPYTLPEVRTLIDGYTVGGHTTADTRQVLNLLEANRALYDLLQAGTFRPDKTTSDRLHTIIASGEAPRTGHFRGEGAATGGGTVSLGAPGRYQAPEHGEGGTDLIGLHQHLVEECAAINDTRLATSHYFCQATLAQFYFDGNKRTARMIANGMLVDAGFDAVFIPAADRAHYNDLLTNMFLYRDEQPMTDYLLQLSRQTFTDMPGN